MNDPEASRAGRCPLVTVIIPTYGHRDLVLETLESVFAQSYEPVEIIVVNDGSPDDTAEVLEPLVRAGRIAYVEQENQGQGAARNRGLAEARGVYVAFLDDDDTWPADKLAWQVALLEQDPEAVCAYGMHVNVFPDGTRRRQHSRERPSGSVEDEFRRRNWLLSPGQALLRTETVRRIGGFDPDIWGSDDWDLYIRLAREGRFLYRPKEALYYRVHGDNASSRRALRHALNHWKVTRKHIGWNVPLLVAHQREAAGYFVPRLRRFAADMREGGKQAAALKAELLATTFRPGLWIRPGFTLPFLRTVGALLFRWTGGPRAPS